MKENAASEVLPKEAEAAAAEAAEAAAAVTDGATRYHNIPMKFT